jgi:lipopolysaccharide/colanic/teichoic acid biosynthesis glycosyltransferase
MLETPRRKTAPDRACSGKRTFDFSPWTNLPPLPAAAPRPMQGAGFAERCVAGAALLLAAPLMAAIAVAITIDSPGGPVFYRQERVGLDRRRREAGGEARRQERRRQPGTGRCFLIWKFRTMIPDAEARTGPIWASENDPRVTRVGRWLRQLRLDELPQLINVVQGHMRLIGPRPERPQFVEKLSAAVPEYRRRHSVPPGITGLAQVQREYDASLDDVRTKLKYDLFYVDNRCWMLNLKILMKTLDVVLRGRGAH